MRTIFVAAALCAALGTLPAADLHLGNRFLNVRMDATGALHVRDVSSGRTWDQRAVNGAVTVQAARAPMVLDLRDEKARIALTASFRLPADRPEIEVTISASGPAAQYVGYPHPFLTARGTSLVVPLNEGILYPVDDAGVRPMSLAAYSGHGICMPWWGVIDDQSGAGVMAIIRTPDDARIEIARAPDTGLYVRPVWDPSRQEFRYERKLTYIFQDKGGYVALAKRYREYARETGLFRTLAEKRRATPAVDQLVGAVNVWARKSIPNKVALCREMKQLGMDRVLWSNGGTPEEIDAINRLGYLTSRYDIYQDVFPPDAPASLKKDGWPDDLVWLPNGQWMKGWAHHQANPDGTNKIWEGGVISSPRQLARARQQVPADLETHAFRCRFIDTTTASPFREDYNPAHPLSRSDDRRYKMALLEFCSKDMNLVTGTETGIDPAVPYVHYFEGMLSLGPYRLPDAGRDTLAYKQPTPDFLKYQVGHFYRIPLWELVYHECVVAQWYWGDYNNKAPEVWDRRDLFNILYGTPPMFMFDQAIWERSKDRFVRSYRDVCPLVRKLGYDEMLAHEYVTPDHGVQRTRWKSGIVVTANFGDAPYRSPEGRVIPPLRWAADEPR